MRIKQINNLPFFTSDKINVTHGFTTRLGGVSTSPCYKSLNLGVRTQDDKSNVRKNYGLVREALGINNLVLAKQEHTDVVIAVDASYAGVGEAGNPPFPSGVDGLITNVPNLALGVFTADCVPVLLYDSVHSAIGAIHSGWRSTLMKISVKAINLMHEKYGSRPEDMVAAIGPSIGSCCFEIGENVAEKFRSAYPDDFDEILTAKGEKYLADVAGCVERDIRKTGVKTIDRSDICTFCRNDIMFSHRCGDKGRQCGFIMIGEKDE